MQLNVTTDYAIRVIVYLSTKGGVVPSGEIADRMGIPKSYVLKIAKKLGDAGYTTTHTGTQGGISLKKEAKTISLLDIIQVMESTTKINRCLEEDKYCSRFATESCPVRSFYFALQNELETKLSSITIAALLNDNHKNAEKEGSSPR